MSIRCTHDQHSYCEIIPKHIAVNVRKSSIQSDSPKNATDLINDFYVYAIDARVASRIQCILDLGEDLVLEYNADINIIANISWHSDNNLTIRSRNNINVHEYVTITNLGTGTLKLMSGIESDDHKCSVNFADNARVVVPNGKVRIYYNPDKNEGHKYFNPQDFDDFVTPNYNLKSYMLVNNHFDLSDIRHFPSMNYALANNITPETRKIMEPIGDKVLPFTGSFDGNNFAISNLEIVGNDNVGLFGIAVTGGVGSVIENIRLHSIVVKGNQYVGALAGVTENFKYNNIQLDTIEVQGKEMVGGVFGTITSSEHADICGFAESVVRANEVFGLFAGVLINTEFPIGERTSLVGISYDNQDDEYDF